MLTYVQMMQLIQRVYIIWPAMINVMMSDMNRICKYLIRDVIVGW